MKNKIYQLILLFSCLSGSLFGQMEVEEALDRASKQYDLYAFQMAMSTYKEVVKAAPENGFAYARIGDCLAQLNQPVEAIKYYEQAVGKPDVPANFPFRYGKTLMTVGHYAKAKRWFELYKSEDRVISEHFAAMCDYATANVDAQPLYMAKNEAINTAASDFAPAILGDKVVYCSSRTDMKRTTPGKNQGDASKNQLLVTQTDKAGMLQAPAFYRSDLQNTYNEGPASFAPTAGRVAFCRNNFVDGNRQVAAQGVNMSLYIADYVDGQWVNVKAFPYNGSDFATGFPALTPDGNTLYFSSTRPNGHGGWDIYVSNWDGQRWTPPVNLGKDINTQGDEVCAFPDDNVLYFSSDFHPGFGGLDVFKALRDKDGQYSQLLHLGPGINSSLDDYGFVYNSNTNVGYLTSNRNGGKGGEDIWKISKRTEDFVVTIEDAKGKPVAGAKVDMSACGGEVATTDAKGQYAFSVTFGQTNCVFKASKAGFVGGSGSLISGKATKVKVVLAAEEAPVMASVKTEEKPVVVPKKSEDLASMDFKTKPAGKSVSESSASTEILAEEVAKPKETTKVADKTKKTESPIVAEIEKPAVMQGYSVQLAAELTAGKDKVDEKAFASLNEFGHVYATQEGKYKKIKVGVYATEAEAEATLKQIVKKGHKDAFVSVEKNVTAELLYKAPAIEAETPIMASVIIAKSTTAKGTVVPKKAGSTPVKEVEMEAKVPTKAEDLVFSVQLASITNSGQAIDMSPYMELSSLGNLYSVPDSVFTKIRLGVWASYDAAEDAKEKVVKKGFKDAILVPEKAVYMTKKILIKDKPTAEADKSAAQPAHGADTKADDKVAAKPTMYADEKPSSHTTTTKDASATPKKVEPSKTVAKKDEPAKVETTKPEVAKTLSPYYVQIASLSNAKSLNKADVEQFGGVVYLKKTGKMTLVYLKDFENLEAAINAKNNAHKGGYKDAFVVKKEKDAFVKIKL